MQIKICGMKYPENILEVSTLSPDYLGFIFYLKSPRFADRLDLSVLNSLPKNIKKVGVFVNFSFCNKDNKLMIQFEKLSRVKISL